MRVEREPNLARFIENTGPYLRRRTAENNLMLGLLGDLARMGAVPGRAAEYAKMSPVLLLVEGPGGGVEGVALQTPPRAVILSRAIDEAIDALVDFALSARLAFPGVLGPDKAADRFAARWAARTGGASVLRMTEMVYELERVREQPSCPGKLREAAHADEQLLSTWLEGFHIETGIEAMDDCLAFVRGKMIARQLFVWDNGAPVSMAAWGGRTEHGVRIGFVYSPPAERRKGYASAVVSALSQRMLDEGSPRCFLFTNAANPTSNKIYQAIGYERISDFRWYDFKTK